MAKAVREVVQNYRSFPWRRIPSDRRLPCTLYVYLRRNQKVIALFNANDEVLAATLARYIDRGLAQIWIAKDDWDAFKQFLRASGDHEPVLEADADGDGETGADSRAGRDSAVAKERNLKGPRGERDDPAIEGRAKKLPPSLGDSDDTDADLEAELEAELAAKEIDSKEKRARDPKAAGENDADDETSAADGASSTEATEDTGQRKKRKKNRASGAGEDADETDSADETDQSEEPDEEDETTAADEASSGETTEEETRRRKKRKKSRASGAGEDADETDAADETDNSELAEDALEADDASEENEGDDEAPARKKKKGRRSFGGEAEAESDPDDDALADSDEAAATGKAAARDSLDALLDEPAGTAEVDLDAALAADVTDPLATAEARALLKKDFATDQSALAAATQRRLNRAIERTLEDSLGETAKTLAALVEEVEFLPDGAHGLHVCHYASLIAVALGISDPDELATLMTAALLHDLGHTQVTLLTKATEKADAKPDEAPTTRPRFAAVPLERESPDHIGHSTRLVSRLIEPNGARVAELIEFHHETFDGKGPRQCRGDAIPLLAQVLAIADRIDLMTSGRWDTVKRSLKEAALALDFQYLRAKQATDFNPALLRRVLPFMLEQADANQELADQMSGDVATNIMGQSHASLKTRTKA